MSTTPPAERYTSARDALRRIPAREGWAALWRGNGANVLRLVPEVGLKFALNDQMRLLFAPADGRARGPGRQAGGGRDDGGSEDGTPGSDTRMLSSVCSNGAATGAGGRAEFALNNQMRRLYARRWPLHGTGR